MKGNEGAVDDII